MNQIYLGSTLINDAFLGADRMEDVLQEENQLGVEWLLVGGGASGGSRFQTGNGGGGGAGRFVSSSLTLFTSASINVTIGLGGESVVTGIQAAGNNGGNSSVVILGTTFTANGGGGGGCATSNNLPQKAGANGGSGGGGGGSIPTGSAGIAVAGTPIAGFGSNGDVGKTTNGGAGGGASVGSQSGLAWLDGVTYSIGGNGFAGAVYTSNGSGGNGATFNTNSGAGVGGVFIIRYIGPPKATGGTITQSGGFTFHTFTSNGTFTY